MDDDDDDDSCLLMCYVVSQSTASYSDSAFDYLSSIIINTTPQHGRHFFDVNCQICTGKIPDPLYDDDRKSSVTTHAAPGDDTVTTEDAGSTPAVVNMSRDPRRSRPTPVTAAAPAPKTELPKPEILPKPEPSPRESSIVESVKSEMPPTPKSPTPTTSIVVPPVPSYQL